MNVIIDTKIRFNSFRLSQL